MPLSKKYLPFLIFVQASLRTANDHGVEGRDDEAEKQI